MISYDAVIEIADVDSYVSFDNAEVGRLIAQLLVDRMTQLGVSDQCVIAIRGDASDPVGKMFCSRWPSSSRSSGCSTTSSGAPSSASTSSPSVATKRLPGRNGVRTARTRIAVFALAAALAAFGGVLAASRLTAASGSAGQGDIFINAIAAAVIGGTSLFCGRGSVYSALLGALVIGSIASGITLRNISPSPSPKLIVTDVVPAAAVISDAVVRSRHRIVTPAPA